MVGLWIQRRLGKLLLLLLMLSGLFACAENHRWDPLAYTVRSGDTLYSIAWRYEMDYREIAQWNNIHPPYAIYPGQRLTMQAVNADGPVVADERPQLLIESDSGQVVNETAAETVPAEAPSQSEAVATDVTVQKGDTLYGIARKTGRTHHQLARWNHLKPPYHLKPGQRLRLSPPVHALGRDAKAARPGVKNRPQVTAVKPAIIQSKPIAETTPQLPRKVDQWQWPVKGRVVKTFKSNDTARKGIGIRGKPGQIVKAAAGGTVVYSGNGLINYGNLVIIKHSHSFLSAYAHNTALLVKEGDMVKPGQQIAKMGRHNKKTAELHFEIRRNGKPVNPLYYLPKS